MSSVLGPIICHAVYSDKLCGYKHQVPDPGTGHTGHGTWWISCQTPGEYHRVRDPFDHRVRAFDHRVRAPVNSSKYIIVFLESMSRPLHVQVVAN